MGLGCYLAYWFTLYLLFLFVLMFRLRFLLFTLPALWLFGFLQASQSVAMIWSQERFFKNMFLACKAFIYQRF